MEQKDKVLKEIHTLMRQFYGEQVDFRHCSSTSTLHHVDDYTMLYPHTYDLGNGDFGYVREDGKRVVIERNAEAIDEMEQEQILTQILALIRRVTSDTSEYYRNSRDGYELYKKSPLKQLKTVVAVLDALQVDIINNCLETFKELIHADVFTDYLEMAEELLDKKYKDAAAVIVGTTLENHIKLLCRKHSIPTTRKDKNHKNIARSVGDLNSTLAAKNIYTKGDQKDITAWSAQRNNAAHGEYQEYNLEKVKLTLKCVRDFIKRHPA